MKVGETNVLDAKSVIRKKPANLQQRDSSFFENEYSHSTCPVRKITYSNVVATEYAIYDQYKLVRESLVCPTHYKRLQFRHLPHKLIFHKKVTLSPAKKYLFVHDYWSNSHYHWYCDLLPRLWCIKEELKEYTLLFPPGGYIRKNAIESLTLAGLNPSDILFMEPDKYYYVPALTMVTHVSISGTIRDDVMQQIKQQIRSNFPGKTGRFARIYISRAKATYRKILNEEDVRACFVNFNYEVINFEDYSLLDQIMMAANTTVLAGIHGAGLTNALFMPDGANLLEFRRNGIHHNQCYWDIASGVNLDYYYYFGQPDSDRPIEGNGCNLRINVNEMEILLESLENKKQQNLL